MRVKFSASQKGPLLPIRKEVFSEEVTFAEALDFAGECWAREKAVEKGWDRWTWECEAIDDATDGAEAEQAGRGQG